MERDGGEEVSSERIDEVSPTSGTTASSRPDCFLVAFRFFSVVTALAAILCIVVNVYSAVRSFKHGYDVFDGIFRCYAVVLAIIVLIAETEWGVFIQFWKVLEYLAGRGMLQIFVAVMTRAYPEYNDHRRELTILQNTASYLLLACGAVYVISGVLCIGFIKRALQEKEVSREQAIKDLQELERRREELEALLVQERV